MRFEKTTTAHLAQERRNNGRLEATNTQMEEGTRRLTNQHTYIYKENSKQRERKGVKRCWKWKNKEWRGQKTKQILKKRRRKRWGQRGNEGVSNLIKRDTIDISFTSLLLHQVCNKYAAIFSSFGQLLSWLAPSIQSESFPHKVFTTWQKRNNNISVFWQTQTPPYGKWIIPSKQPFSALKM